MDGPRAILEGRYGAPHGSPLRSSRSARCKPLPRNVCSLSDWLASPSGPPGLPPGFWVKLWTETSLFVTINSTRCASACPPSAYCPDCSNALYVLYGRGLCRIAPFDQLLVATSSRLIPAYALLPVVGAAQRRFALPPDIGGAFPNRRAAGYHFWRRRLVIPRVAAKAARLSRRLWRSVTWSSSASSFLIATFLLLRERDAVDDRSRASA